MAINNISSSLGLVGNFGGPTEIVNFFQTGLDDLENSLPTLLDDYLILQFQHKNKYKMGGVELGFNPNDETFHIVVQQHLGCLLKLLRNIDRFLFVDIDLQALHLLAV